MSPRPEAKAKAAEGLARLTLGKGTKTSSGTDPKAAFTSKPVDAGGGGCRVGAPPTTSSELPAPTKVKANAGKRLSGEKKTLRPSEASPTKPSKASPTKPRATKKARVPAPTGSGAHKPQWDSFVDWKMMEHQDYADLPDDQFEKLSEKLHIKEKWRPMVSYLVSLGLTTKELEKCLVNCEEIFKRPVAKVMTRVEYLQNELGFEGNELRKLIHKEPAILLQRNRHSIPRCRYLTELGIPSEKLPSMLRKQPQILHLSVQKGLMPRVAYFKKELLIPEAEIPKMLERNPAVLTFSVENQIKPRVDFLKDLGISHDGVVKMIVRHPHLLQYSFEGLEEHINFLTSIGMDEQDVVHTVTRLSQLFSLSVKDSLRPKFKYLTDALGGDHKTCVKFPRVLLPQPRSAHPTQARLPAELSVRPRPVSDEVLVGERRRVRRARRRGWRVAARFRGVQASDGASVQARDGTRQGTREPIHQGAGAQVQNAGGEGRAAATPDGAEQDGVAAHRRRQEQHGTRQASRTGESRDRRERRSKTGRTGARVRDRPRSKRSENRVFPGSNGRAL